LAKAGETHRASAILPIVMGFAKGSTHSTLPTPIRRGNSMTDKVSAAVRSKMMAAVRGKDTGPKRAVRSALFSAGYRYRLHRRDLPGSPDIVLPRYRIAVFVHGCFWHGHDCPRGRRPASNVEFWNRKLDGNLARDRANAAALETAGWTVVIVWQCSAEEAIKRLLLELAVRAHPRTSAYVSELAR
jgi:DNA mismatch endonuclease (patch repair protein)